MKSLHHGRKERFQSASEMLAALESYLLAKYDHIPGYLHLAHFMNDLFTDDIARDGVKITLKPLPYEIRRIPGTLAQALDEEASKSPIESGGIEEIRFEPTEPEAISLGEESAPRGEIHLTIPPAEESIPVEEKVDEEVEEEKAEEESVMEIEPIEEVLEDPLEDSFASPPIQERQVPEEEAAPVPTPAEPEDQPPATFEIELEEPLKKEEVKEQEIRIDDELASLDRKSGRRNRTFLIVLLVLALVAIGIVWIQMNRTGSPPPPPARALTTTPQTESPAAETADIQSEEGIVPPQENNLTSDSTVTEPASTDKKIERAPGSEETQTKAIAQKPPEKKKTPATSPPVTKPKAQPPAPRNQTPAAPLETKKNTAATSNAMKADTPEPESDQQVPLPQTEEKTATPQPEPKVQETPPPPPPKEVVKEGQIASSVDTKPIAISTPFPKLKSRTLRRLKKGTTVVISFLVNHKGLVERIKFIRRSGIPEIDMQIASAISGWTYRPALKDNVKVKIWQTKSLNIKK